MEYVAEWTKRVREVQDYEIDFTDYLGGLSDAISTYTTEVEAGITLDSHGVSGPRINVRVSGGVDDNNYTVTAIITTAAGRVRAASILIMVRGQ